MTRMKGFVWVGFVFLVAWSFATAAEQLPKLSTPAAIVVDEFEGGKKSERWFEMWDVRCDLPTPAYQGHLKPSCTINSIVIWEKPPLGDTTRAQVTIGGPVESDEVRWVRATPEGDSVFYVRTLSGHWCGPVETMLTVHRIGNIHQLVDLNARMICGADCKTECTYAASHDKSRQLRLPLMNGIRP
jgi:hypothetical protein